MLALWRLWSQGPWKVSSEGLLMRLLSATPGLFSLPCLQSVTFFLSMCVCLHAKLLQPCLSLCTLWTVALQALLSMVFSRQEYWSGLPSPPPGDLSGPGTKPASLMSPALAGRFFLPLVTARKPRCLTLFMINQVS